MAGGTAYLRPLASTPQQLQRARDMPLGIPVSNRAAAAGEAVSRGIGDYADKRMNNSGAKNG